MAEQWSIMRLADELQTEADAYLLMEKMRWNGTPVCPHCASERVHFLTPADGVSRSTRTGSKSQRRVWFCGGCRKQFSVLTGTVFHGTKISLRKWMFVLFEMVSSKNGVAAREIERKYSLTNKTAWFMLHRIREAMKSGPLAEMMRGTVVADETFIGGKPKNKHQQGKPRGGYSNRKRGGGQAHLQPVVSLVNKETGEVRSRVIPDITGATLAKAIGSQVDVSGSKLHTDAGKQYRDLGQAFISHEWVDHSVAEYVRGDVSTNQAEGYFSQLKRSIDGTHHHVSREHLQMYLSEFDYRYSTRTLSDTARLNRLMGQVAGRRLAYKQPRYGLTNS